MRPKTATYLNRLSPTEDYLVREFVDNYEDGVMSRRDMLERVFRITGSTAVTAGLLSALGVPPVYADPLVAVPFQAPTPSAPMSPFTVPEGDPTIVSGMTTFPSGGATIMGYWARPRADGRYPAVLISHENAGTSEHFRDIARRFAKNRFVALHLDLLSRQGGTDAVPANERGAILTAGVDQFVEDFRAGMAYLRGQPFVLGDRIGMTGYCYGGGMTWNVAIKEPSLRAAAPFYGRPAYPDQVGNVRAAVLGVYAANDAGVNSSIDTNRQQLEAERRTFRISVYPDAPHGFFNDTRAASYVESAATAAWRDTLAWFNTYLRAGALPGTGDGDGDGDGAAPEADGMAEPAAEAAPAESPPESAE
ncbi:MAG: dienelactone hydrolase family protein [Chloroflexota bacterium]|nr:dienelactone hydrolase family protein [Chloroflexota bacterium]